jgi:hypothetical protein
MKRLNFREAFRQMRAENKRAKEAAVERGRNAREAWAAYGRRRAALHKLMNLFPSDQGPCALDVEKATALMIEYAQTLPAAWLRARVDFVSERLAELAADAEYGEDTRLRQIQLRMLALASAGDEVKVAEVFREASSGDADVLEDFRRCIVNWLADKVVDTWPPLPRELMPPVEVSTGDGSAGQAEAPSQPPGTACTAGEVGNDNSAAPTAPPAWLTYSEAMAVLKLSRTRVCDYVKSGALVANGMDGKKKRVSAESVALLRLRLEMERMHAMGRAVSGADAEAADPDMAVNPCRPSIDELAERASKGRSVK